MKTWLLKFKAFFRLSDQAVCEASRGMGMVDYHDYPDSILGTAHMVEHTCKRCGKAFII